MGLVDRFERKLESTVGDAFARVFGGSIVPQEVEAMLRREADTGAREVLGGRILAPNDYVITLSVPDYQKVSADPDLTSTTFAKHLEGYIHEQGWQTYGDVVVRFEQSPNLHTGQFRARGAVNPDSTTGEPAPPRELSSNAEPGVPPMTDNPNYRGGQGQGRPADEYYDERYGRPEDGAPRSARPAPPAGRRRLPAAGRAGLPAPSGLPRPRRLPGPGWVIPTRATRHSHMSSARPPATARRKAAATQTRATGRPPAATARRKAASRATAHRPATTTTDVSPHRAVPTRVATAGPSRARPTRTRAATPTRAATRIRAATAGSHTAVRNTPSPITDATASLAGGGYAEPGYAEPAGGGYDYGQPAGPAGGYGGGYGQADYAAGGTAVTLQLDDGSGRTYQLREGANVIGRGQDAQFRLPDTGVSRRHLEIRWDGQVALLSDLNSTNGTTVNNAPVQEWQLADGDVIRLGHSEIIVRVH